MRFKSTKGLCSVQRFVVLVLFSLIVLSFGCGDTAEETPPAPIKQESGTETRSGYDEPSTFDIPAAVKNSLLGHWKDQRGVEIWFASDGSYQDSRASRKRYYEVQRWEHDSNTLTIAKSSNVFIGLDTFVGTYDELIFSEDFQTVTIEDYKYQKVDAAQKP